MKRVVALQTWSNGTITMDEKSVLDIEDALAADLIEKGIVADAATYFGGGSGGGELAVNISISDNVATLDKTFDEIAGADAVYIKAPDRSQCFLFRIVEESYVVEITLQNAENQDVSLIAIPFKASSGSGYPSATLE